MSKKWKVITKETGTQIKMTSQMDDWGITEHMPMVVKFTGKFKVEDERFKLHAEAHRNTNVYLDNADGNRIHIHDLPEFITFLEEVLESAKRHYPYSYWTPNRKQTDHGWSWH